MPDEISQLVIVPIAGTVLILLLLVFLLAFFFAFQRRQLQHRQEKRLLHARFSREILQAQFEVQNITLQQVSQDLHDNIGQLLSVARINLNLLEESGDLQRDRRYICQTNEIIANALNDVRALTKSFDSDFISDFGLENGIRQEFQRIEKTGFIETELRTEGGTYAIGQDREIMIFRIFQELLTNALKHSRASKVSVFMSYQPTQLEFDFRDNGIGFMINDQPIKSISNSGAGLRNVERRIELLKGNFLINSELGVGVHILIHIPRT